MLGKPYRVGRSDTGLGLFATEAIQRGTFIIEYIGLRISKKEVANRRTTRFLFQVNSRWTIDGSPRWNIARYINHACRPNAEAIESRGRIRIRAKRRIQPGEEITYNYGRSYFEAFMSRWAASAAPASGPTLRTVRQSVKLGTSLEVRIGTEGCPLAQEA